MKKFYSVIFLFLIFSVNAQECGTLSVTENQSFVTSANDASSSSYCINIKFHIVRQSDGSGGFDSSQLVSAINLLNQFYLNHNINFSNSGFDYINNSTLNNIGETESTSKLNQLSALNNTANSLDIYIVDTAYYNGSAGSIISKKLYLRSDRVLTETLAHEIGHCFNLYHTFHGPAEGSGCQENINGSNCTTCGDFVCDTPADANVGISGGYNPDLGNLMCYAWWGNIRNHFSTQQGIRMRNALGGSSILQSIINPTCGIVNYKLKGAIPVCYQSTMSYVFLDPTPPAGSTITWASTPELTILNSPIPPNNSPQIFVKSNLTNNNYNSNAYLSVTVNGVKRDLPILMGPKPFSYNVINTPANISSDYCDASFHYTSIDVVNSDKEGSYSYSFSMLSTATNTDPNLPITYTQVSGAETGTSRFLFKIPRSKISATGPALIYAITINSPCASSPIVSYNNAINIKPCYSGGTTYRMSKNKEENSFKEEKYSEESTNYTVYPNPTKDLLFITLGDQAPGELINSYAILYDVLGVDRKHIRIETNMVYIDTSVLPKGIYILKVNLEGQIKTHKIVVE
jgi:hypothetical protein